MRLRLRRVSKLRLVGLMDTWGHRSFLTPASGSGGDGAGQGNNDISITVADPAEQAGIVDTDRWASGTRAARPWELKVRVKRQHGNQCRDHQGGWWTSALCTYHAVHLASRGCTTRNMQGEVRMLGHERFERVRGCKKEKEHNSGSGSGGGAMNVESWHGPMVRRYAAVAVVQSIQIGERG
jgi:hypothetical protein